MVPPGVRARRRQIRAVSNQYSLLVHSHSLLAASALLPIVASVILKVRISGNEEDGGR